MPKFAQYLTKEQEAELSKIANAIVANGRGILAADESTGICPSYCNIFLIFFIFHCNFSKIVVF